MTYRESWAREHALTFICTATGGQTWLLKTIENNWPSLGGGHWQTLGTLGHRMMKEALMDDRSRHGTSSALPAHNKRFSIVVCSHTRGESSITRPTDVQ